VSDPVEEPLPIDDEGEPATVLYRPVGTVELELIRESGMRRFPPRLFFQPIFYPVLTEDYATRIARAWNTKDPSSGFVGYVLRFEVDTEYLSRYEVELAGSSLEQEYWIPADELEEFNDHIVGEIEIVAEHRPKEEQSSYSSSSSA
jgi:hypothetical protein